MKETTEEYIVKLKAGLATLETALYKAKMSAQEVNTRKNKQIAEQQAEIEALKAGKIRAYDNGVEDGRKPNTNLVKELTDEEIYACFHQYFVLGEPKPTHYELEYEDLIDFARAILRKASEK